MPTSNIHNLSHLKAYLKSDIPKIEEIDSVITTQTKLESNVITLTSSERFLSQNTVSTRGIIDKIKKEIETRINTCSINTRNFKSNKVMNDIMTDMYIIQTEEINTELPGNEILNEKYFVNQHFFNSQEVAYEDYNLNIYRPIPSNNTVYKQTFSDLQRLYVNQGIGFLNLYSNEHGTKPHAIVMRNILGYILYNCNPQHYLNIYTQMKTVTTKLIAMQSYDKQLKEEIWNDDLENEYDGEVENVSDDRLRTYLQEMLGFVDNVLALLKRNKLKEHLLLNNTRNFTPEEYGYIDSSIPILQKIVNHQITQIKSKEDLILKTNYKEIFDSVLNSITSNPNLKKFAKIFGLITTRNIGFGRENIKKRAIHRKDLVFQSEVFQSMLYDFKFKEVRAFDIEVTSDNLDERLYLVSMAMVIHNLTTDERNKFNYVAPMKGFNNQEYSRNLYRIYSEVVKTLPNKFDDIMNKYIDCFRDFVFKKNSIALGLGAYLISLVILPYLPYKLINSQAIIQNTDLGVFHELSCFGSMYSIIEEMANGHRDYVEYFHQAPYMLGFFSSINPSRRAGTCQDIALIRLMKYDMENKLYGMSMVNYPKITHWMAIDFTTNYDRYDKGLFITHNNVITLDAVGNRAKLRGKKPDKFKVTDDTPDIFERKDYLIATDLQKITEKNYQARANVFLAMTMAHVYRHTDIKELDGENNGNGVAFNRDGTSSFEKAVLKYITDRVPMIDTKRSNTTETSQQKFNFSSIETIFDRYYDNIVQGINLTKKTKETKFGGGGKPNPYIKVGKYNNRTIYKKKNTFYVRVKDSTTNKMTYKRLTKSMINSM